jgi:hypothetical protein
VLQGRIETVSSPPGDDYRVETVRLVDQFEGRAWLEWWADASACLGSVEVIVVIRTIGRRWDAGGCVVNEADVEAFEFLCDLNPVFQLRFEDGSTATVSVRADGCGGLFTLADHDGSAGRPVPAQQDL